MQGRILEDPARDCGEVEAADGILALVVGMADTSTWSSLLGDGGRLFKARNGDHSAERNRCFFCRWSDIGG